jgi:hypothetical protein
VPNVKMLADISVPAMRRSTINFRVSDRLEFCPDE